MKLNCVQGEWSGYSLQVLIAAAALTTYSGLICCYPYPEEVKPHQPLSNIFI
jgi:hypothetical protein